MKLLCVIPKATYKSMNKQPNVGSSVCYCEELPCVAKTWRQTAGQFITVFSYGKTELCFNNTGSDEICGRFVVRHQR